MTTLIPCSGCARHVRSTETACPFCARTQTPIHARALDPSSRLGRAAMFAFRATTVAALSTLAACGDETAPSPPTSVAPPETPPFDPTIMQPYGAPPLSEQPPPSEVPPAPPSSVAPSPSDVPSAPESRARPERPTSMHALYGAAPYGDLGEGSGIPD